MNGQNRDNIKIGSKVLVVQKQDQRTVKKFYKYILRRFYDKKRI